MQTLKVGGLAKNYFLTNLLERLLERFKNV